MVDEAKLRSPINSTFEALVVQCAVRCCYAELAPFWWPMLAAGIAVFSAFPWFAEYTSQICNGFVRIQEAVGDQASSRPPNSDHDLFLGTSLALGSTWELLLSPVTRLVIVKSSFCHISQSERDMCTPMFIAALFIIARTWKQPRCPSADEWIRKLWYRYTMEYYSTRVWPQSPICDYSTI